MQELDEKGDTKDEDSDETLVLVELAGIIDVDFGDKIIDKDYKLLGIETEEPILQIGHNIFTGEFTDPMGTIAIFEEKTEENDTENKQLELKYLVNKKLRMTRTFVTEKENKSSILHK